MKDNMLLYPFLGLLLHWALPVTSAKIIFDLHKTNLTDPPIIPLDMAVNSVDDMYFNCSESMTNEVEKKIFREETENETFLRAWKSAERCAENRQKLGKALTKNHMQAICLYTAGGKETFYSTFNDAVRTGGSKYTTSFHYHSFHFWLTSAVQILSGNQQQCYHTYRRTKHTFETKVDERIRFGFFASSSLFKNLTHFGEKTCFCIYTCYGAYLKAYPRLGDKEQEVLIPPYEIFKITKKNSPKCQLGCKVEYTLESAGVLSYQNCKVVRS